MSIPHGSHLVGEQPPLVCPAALSSNGRGSPMNCEESLQMSPHEDKLPHLANIVRPFHARWPTIFSVSDGP